MLEHTAFQQFLLRVAEAVVEICMIDGVYANNLLEPFALAKSRISNFQLKL